MSQRLMSHDVRIARPHPFFSALAAAVALLGGPAIALAQAATPYVATTSPATLVPLPLDGGTAQLLSMTYPADTAGIRVNLPFSFNFYERTYTSVMISSNTYLTFDASNSGTSATSSAFPATSNPKELVAVWMADTKCDSIKWQVIGWAPRRKAVIEWNCYWWQNPSDSYVAQAWLTEGSSTIEVVYGPNFPRTSGYGSGVRVGVSNFDGSSYTYGLGSYCNSSCALMPSAWPENTRIIYSQGPDLRVVSVDIPPEGYAGVHLPVHTRIENVGGLPAVDFTVQLWISPTPSKGGDAIPLGGPAPIRQSANLGDSVSFHLRPKVPLSIGTGSYYVVAEADPEQVVPLPSRISSIGASEPLTIGVPAPNLAALDVVPPAELHPGRSFDLSWTAANVGNAPAYYASYQVLLSASETPSANSRVLSIQGSDGRLMNRGFVDIAERVNSPDRLYRDVPRVEKVFLPADVESGRYYVAVQMDPDYQVFEHDRLNNIGVSQPVVVQSSTSLAVVTPAVLPVAEVGSPYTIVLKALGGDGSYFWKVSNGSTLPPGLSLIEFPAGAREVGLPFTTIFSGTPTVVGDFEFSLDVSSGPLQTSRRFTLSVLPQELPLVIQTRKLPPASFEGQYHLPLVAGGGQPPYVWSLASGRLADGIEFGAGGTISGRALEDGEFAFTVRVTDARGVSATQSLVLLVLPPASISCGTTRIGPHRLGEAVDVALRAGGGAAVKFWESLELWYLPSSSGKASEWFAKLAPPGLSLNADGRVTGAPTRAGLYDWLVGVKEDPSSNNPTRCMIRVEVLRDRNLTITTTNLVDAVVGQRYSARLDATGGEGELVWELGPDEKLPAGLNLSPDGILTGTPTGEELAGETMGSVAFSIRVFDSMRREGTAPLSITLHAEAASAGAAEQETKSSSCQSVGADPSLLAVAAALGLASLRRRRR
ncbi:MAG TPA: putative Ig domain-containing protein [Vulgatibacter sp.]|nr:putative Ig domain-containing protein [Vulgatibacter sp.]